MENPPMIRQPDPAQAWRANADRLARWYTDNLQQPDKRLETTEKAFMP